MAEGLFVCLFVLFIFNCPNPLSLLLTEQMLTREVHRQTGKEDLKASETLHLQKPWKSVLREGNVRP